MLMHTHHKIAHTVFHSLPEELKQELSWKSFKKGNRNPDFMIKYKRFKHTVCASFDRIQSDIETLLHMDLNKKKFSKELGYICHFISDYACAFHNNPEVKKEGFFKHMKFERDIERIAREKNLIIKDWKGHLTFDDVMTEIYEEVKVVDPISTSKSAKQDLYKALDFTYRFVQLFLERRLQLQ